MNRYSQLSQNIFMLKFCFRNCLFILPFIFLSSAFAEESQITKQKRPRIALVLSGGGALGMAHIGVLKKLEEMSIPVDCVVGTSMGALIGGAYADGITPDEMESVLVNTDISLLFDDYPPRKDITQKIKRDNFRAFFDFSLGFNDWKIMLPSGASSGYKFELFLQKLLNLDASRQYLNFDMLPVPYRAIATDIETGDMKVFHQGQLTTTMRASMSLPAIVAPISINGRSYLDGGLVRNLPVDIGRQLCGDIVIAVNLGTKPKSQDQIRSSIDVAMQSLTLLTEQNVADSLSELREQDILISPELSDFDLLSFNKQREIIDRGTAAAIKQQKRLSQLSIPREDYLKWRSTRFKTQSRSTRINLIEAKTAGYVTSDSVLREISIKDGELLDQDKLHSDLETLYGRSDFAYVGYSIDQVDNETKLVINADSKPWGPGYVKFGVGALTDFNSPTQFNTLATYRRTWINDYGAEWRTDLQLGYDSLLRTEFIQPLQVTDGAFVTPYLEAQRYFIPIYIAEVRAGDFIIAQKNAGIDIGVMGNLGEIRVGGYYSRINTKPEFGIATPIFENEHIKQSGIRADLIFDQIDNVSFPRAGIYLKLYYEDSEVREDVNVRYKKAQAILTGAYSLAENTVKLHYEWGDELSGLDDLPVYDAFELGGPGRLSGLYLDQLTGSRYDLGTLTYYYRVSQLPIQIGNGFYVGGSLETGKINDYLSGYTDTRINAGSLFVATETILGTLTVSYGLTDTHQHAWYLQLGPQF